MSYYSKTMTSGIGDAHVTYNASYNDTNVIFSDVGIIETLLSRANKTMDDGPSPISIEVEKILNGYIAVIVIFMGLIGNFLTVVVLTRKTMHSSTNFFLAALAIWDMLVLVSTLFLISLGELSTDYKAIVFPYIVVYIYPFALTAQTSTVWITVSFTVERFIAVCHPLKAATMCTIARARIVIFCVSMSAFLYNLSRWFEYELTESLTEQNNQTVSSTNFGPSILGRNQTYKNVYFFGFYPFIMFIIPLSTLAVLNTCLVLAVKRSRQQQKDMNVRQSRENNVTLMLVSVVVVFMLCQVPAMIYNVAYSIDYSMAETSAGWRILSSVRNFLVTFNSAINFILYCAFGQKFRRVFIRTFCTLIIDENDFNSITFHGNATTVTNFDKNNQKYKTLLLKHKAKGGNQMEMYSNMTQNTMVSRYSPCVSRSTSPSLVMSKIQNGRKTHDGEKVHLTTKSLEPCAAQTCMDRHLLNNRTPSPV